VTEKVVIVFRKFSTHATLTKQLKENEAVESIIVQVQGNRSLPKSTRKIFCVSYNNQYLGAGIAIPFSISITKGK
jgi:hypothetical protein